MTRSVLIGIDLGTTVLKVCAFDGSSGKTLGRASRRLPVRSFPDGGREQNPREADQSLREVLHELQTQLGNRWDTVSGIGLSAQGGSSILAERDSGRVLSPMVLWNDGRAQLHAAALAKQRPKAFWRKFILNDVPPHGLARMRWLQERHPEWFHDGTLHIGAGEYLFHRLTGVWRQDPCHALQTGAYNAAKRKLDPSLLDLINLPLSFVAPLRRGHETAPVSKRGARLLNLPEGLPVAGPYIDQEAGYLSAVGGSTRKPLHASLGTAWVGNFVLEPGLKGASAFQLAVPSPVNDGRLVIQPLLCGNTAWDWGLRTFVHPDLAQALAEAEQIFRDSLLPPDGLLALPWFTQPNPLAAGAYGGGAFFGLSDQTPPADALRALAAGMTYELFRVLADVKKRGAIDSVVLGGGASKGEHFRREIAALFDPLPVCRQVDEDLAAARGSVYAFNARAAESKTERIRPPAPPVQDRLRKGFECYRETFDKLYRPVPAGQAFCIEEKRS